MKKLISVLSCLCILLSHSYYSYAVESTQLKDENYSYEYYNKDTGEYFIIKTRVNILYGKGQIQILVLMW